MAQYLCKVEKEKDIDTLLKMKKFIEAKLHEENH